MNIEVLNTKINALRESEVLEKIDRIMHQKKPSLICTVNTEMIIKAKNDDELKNILNSYSSINLADGVGLLWASRFQSLKVPSEPVAKEIIIFLQWLITIIMIPILPKYFKHPIPERIAGSDFIWKIAQFATDNKYKIYLLGGKETIAEKTALKLQTDIYGLKIAGVNSSDPDKTDKIIESIVKSNADILFVAYGVPKQEKWLRENLKKTGVKLGIGVGGSFDFIAGSQKRAPTWMQRTGLEWLFRLITEPMRFKRQLALPYFLYLNLIEKYKKNAE